MEKTRNCWCNNSTLVYFSFDYQRCQNCNTLVSQNGLTLENTLVKNDEQDFYGKNYWLTHQSNDLGYPTIFSRARTDLSERCLHWIQTILRYKFPPAKSIELGCAHGGFVAMLKQCGYDASGLEMSPWIAQFAHDSFQIPILNGPIEEQEIPAGSLDMIVMMDVLEHLPNPVSTMHHCMSLLKSDGILVVQTPNYPLNKTYGEMVVEQHPFLEQLKADEHLYLFNQYSMQSFFEQLTGGAVYIQFEDAIFAQYDMFMVVSRQPLISHSQEQVDQFLSSSVNGRFIQAMLDIAIQRDNYIRFYQGADIDRVARLKRIDELAGELEALK